MRRRSSTQAGVGFLAKFQVRDVVVSNFYVGMIGRENDIGAILCSSSKVCYFLLKWTLGKIWGPDLGMYSEEFVQCGETGLDAMLPEDFTDIVVSLGELTCTCIAQVLG